MIQVPAGADTKAIQTALSQVEPGDTVRLAAGVYRVDKTLTLTRGGATGRPVVIEGAGAGKTILKGSELVTGWVKVRPGVWKVGDREINSQQLLVDGWPLQQIGVQNQWQANRQSTGKTQLLVVGEDLRDLRPGSFYYDKTSHSIYCMLADQSDPNGHVMEATIVQGQLLMISEASHGVIRGIGFMHSTDTLVGIAGAMDWLIENCAMRFGAMAGLGLSVHDTVVRHCDISWNGRMGIGVSGPWKEWKSTAPAGEYKYFGLPNQHVVLEDLNVSHNNYRNFDKYDHAGAMKLIPGVRGATVRRCRVVGNLGAGIWFDGPLGDNLIEDNFVADNMGAGIMYEIGVRDQEDRYSCLIRNNRVINNETQGIYIASSRDAIVDHNTCYGNRYNISLHGMPRTEPAWGNALTGNVVTNNIVGGSPKEIEASLNDIVLFVGENSSNNVIKDNFYMDKPGRTHLLSLVGSASYSGMDSVFDLRDPRRRAAANKLGYAQGAKIGDPQFVDIAGMDFRLKPGSPAEGKGWQEPVSGN
ncbi:MAG: right-handed parallel beta-helix repeat-containing protein [Phycisphaerales bacterium]|nr:right-handed parallel beta-helix repeat-containing protein [Phycisphaerales bacterium]